MDVWRLCVTKGYKGWEIWCKKKSIAGNEFQKRCVRYKQKNKLRNYGLIKSESARIFVVLVCLQSIGWNSGNMFVQKYRPRSVYLWLKAVETESLISRIALLNRIEKFSCWERNFIPYVHYVGRGFQKWSNLSKNDCILK